MTEAKLYVYRNLHRKCWSVRHKGIVIRHEDDIVMPNVHFKVNRSGRRRVVREGRKNVHAFAVAACTQRAHWYPVPGETSRFGEWGCWRQVKYNPYDREYFYTVKDLMPVNHSVNVFLTDKGEMWAERPTWKIELE